MLVCWIFRWFVQWTKQARCYIGEVLSKHLIFADDICVFCSSVRGLQSILDVCQAYAESHRTIFNCRKTVFVTFEAKSAKNSHLITDTGWSKRKICYHYKYLGVYCILNCQMTRTFRDKCDTNIVQKTSCESVFPCVQCS